MCDVLHRRFSKRKWRLQPFRRRTSGLLHDVQSEEIQAAPVAADVTAPMQWLPPGVLLFARRGSFHFSKGIKFNVSTRHSQNLLERNWFSLPTTARVGSSTAPRED